MTPFNHLSFYLAALGSFWQEKINGQIFRWNLTIIFGQIIYLLIRFNDLPPQVPFFFTLSWGESQLASTSTLFVLPTLSIIVGLINNFLAAFILRSSTLFSRLLVIFSLIFSLLSAISLIKIIDLVT